MKSTASRTGTHRTTVTAAATLVLFAALAPLFNPMVACSMPCCNWMAVSSSPMSAAACADHCGMRSNSNASPVPVVAQSENVQIALVPVEGVDSSTAPIGARPHAIARQLEIPHSADAALYLYNSVFLI